MKRFDAKFDLSIWIGSWYLTIAVNDRWRFGMTVKPIYEHFWGKDLIRTRWLRIWYST